MTSSVPNLQQPSNWVNQEVDHVLPTHGEEERVDHHPVVHLEGAVAPKGGEDSQEGLCWCQGVQPPGDPSHLQGSSH